MKTDDTIKKWLAGELSDAERRKFEDSEEFSRVSRLLKALQRFKSPGFDVEGAYQGLHESIVHSNTRRTRSLFERMVPVLKVAAVVLIVLSVGYFAFDRYYGGEGSAVLIAEQGSVYLPDSSYVALNADSRIRYAGKSWKRERKVELQGEAFFSVKEGAQFRVLTAQGEVTVLGTEFSVTDREHYFQVTCYSGSVKVTAGSSPVILRPNLAFRIVAGREETLSTAEKEGPGWLRGESNFRSVPFGFVIRELERQYRVSVETGEVDLQQLFTGSFSHDDLETALEAVTVPANLKYEINENKIVIAVVGN
jgi:transmembrane sensor